MSMQRAVLWVLGLVLIGVGVLGFFQDPILGIFEVDPLHNILHMLSGLLSLAAVMLGNGIMRLLTRLGGGLYLAFALAGFFIPMRHVFGLFIANAPDHILHLGVAIALFWVGFSGRNHPASILDEPGDTTLSTPV